MKTDVEYTNIAPSTIYMKILSLEFPD